MKKAAFLFVLFCTAIYGHAQDEIVIDLDSIKNIKTTRYSSVNEVGVGISLGGKTKQKLPSQTNTINLENEKPSVLFRTVHGALINPKIFYRCRNRYRFST
jgi:hypothetical protein